MADQRLRELERRWAGGEDSPGLRRRLAHERERAGRPERVLVARYRSERGNRTIHALAPGPGAVGTLCGLPMNYTQAAWRRNPSFWLEVASAAPRVAYPFCKTCWKKMSKVLTHRQRELAQEVWLRRCPVVLGGPAPALRPAAEVGGLG